MLTAACCFSIVVRVRIRFSVRLVSGYAHVFILLFLRYPSCLKGLAVAEPRVLGFASPTSGV